MKRYTVNASLATSSDPWAYVSDRLAELIADLGGDPQVVTQYSRWDDTIKNILYMLDQNALRESNYLQHDVYRVYADTVDVGEYISDEEDGEFLKVVDITEGPYGIIFKLDDGSKRVYQEREQVFVDESKYRGV